MVRLVVIPGAGIAGNEAGAGEMAGRAGDCGGGRAAGVKNRRAAKPPPPHVERSTVYKYLCFNGELHI